MHIPILLLCITLSSLLPTPTAENLGEDEVQQIHTMFNDAISHFNKGELIKSEKIWKKLVKMIPQLKEPWENLGVTLEQQGKTGEAIEVYESAVLDGRLDESLKPYAHLCTVLVQSYQEAMKLRSAVARSLKKKCEDYCSKGIRINPENLKLRQTYGVYLIESMDFKGAIVQLKKAVELNPDDAATRLFLSTAYSRSSSENVENAVLEAEKSIELDPNAQHYHNLAITLSVGSFQNPKTLGAYMESTRVIGERTKNAQCPKGYKVINGWKGFLDGEYPHSKYGVTVSVLEKGSDEVYGEKHPHILREQHLDDLVNIQFKEHDIVLAKLENIYITGTSGIMWKDCAVFTGSHGYVSRVVDEFKGDSRVVKHIKGPVAVLIQQNQKNYYHFMAETVSRLIYVTDMFEDKPNLKLLLPKDQRDWFEQILDLLDIPVTKAIWYDSYQSGIHLEEAYFVDWMWREENDLHPLDTSRNYYPPRQALHRMRAYMKEKLGKDINEEDKKVIYVSRTDASVRKIDSVDETLLVTKILHNVKTDNFELVVLSKMPVKFQISTFLEAAIIIGPHGAGLTNMMWSDPGTVVIDFPMKPNTDNCFGYLASTMGHQFWLVPEISSYYYGNFPQLTEDERNAFVEVLKFHVEGKSFQRDWSSEQTSDDPEQKEDL